MGLPTTTVPLFPSGNIPVPARSLDFTSQFDYVRLESGLLTLTITNNLPILIDFPQPVVLKNNSASPVDSTVITSFSFGGTLTQGQSVSSSSSLASKFLRGNLRTASTQIHTNGSAGSVSFTASSGISFTLSSGTLIADSAKAVIPNQTVTSINDSVVTIDDSVSVQQATFRQGVISAALINNLDMNVGIFLRVENLVNISTGNKFVIQQTLAPRDSFVFPVAMDALKIDTTILNPPIGTSLKFSVGISSVNSGSQKSVVSKKDFVRSELRAGQPLVLKSVTGRIKPTRIAINSGSSGPRLNEALTKLQGNFAFDSVKLALNLGVSGGFPTDYNLRVIAMTRKTPPVRMDSIYVPPASSSQPANRGIMYPGLNQSTQIVLDNSSGLNVFLAKFFPNFPDTFIVRGDLRMNPPSIFPTNQGLQRVDDTSKVYASIDTYFPLKLGITNGVLIDTVSLDSKQTFDKDFITSVKQGTMYLQVTNGLPFQMTFRAALLGRLTPTSPRDTLLRIPSTGTKTIQAATVNTVDGTVRDSLTSLITLNLTGSDLDKFNYADAMWFRFDIVTTSGVSTVKIRDKDFIRILASANLVYQLNKPK